MRRRYVTSFHLIPFPADDLPDLEITGMADRIENHLTIHYTINGDVENILLPRPSAPSRKHDLWKATCFEFFLAIPNQPQYWEFNLSPSGAWNVYVMDAYRQVNMREETRIKRLQFEVRKESGRLSLETALDLNPIIERDKSIEVGISTIIKSVEENESYWALMHPHAKADFHSREGFVIEIPGSE